jgi:plasmid replication initiation protein
MELVERNIVLENRLLTSQFSLELSEKAVVYSILAGVDQSKEISPNREFTLSVNDFSTIRGISRSFAFRQLKETVTSLYEKEFVYKEENEKGQTIKRRVRFVQDISYNEAAGQVSLQFSNKILPFLFALKEKYTSLKLLEVSTLKSVYSSRLFEIFSSEKFKIRQDRNKGEGISIIPVEELVFMLDSNPNLKYAMFKQRVIIPAIKELNNNLMKVTFIENKVKAKVDSLTFKYKFIT